MKSRAFIFLAIALALASCESNRLSSSEKQLINKAHSDSAMRVLSVFNPEDSLFLRKIASPAGNPSNKHLQLLSERMLSTVLHPASQGVGIAAPQVGISRRLILVQRFDKEGEPFETYFDPVVLTASKQLVTRDEGCLSIPGYRGPVERPDVIEVEYINNTGEKVAETVEGFTARIFLHEIDHLNGILYTDLLKADSLFRKVD